MTSRSARLLCADKRPQSSGVWGGSGGALLHSMRGAKQARSLQPRQYPFRLSINILMRRAIALRNSSMSCGGSSSSAGFAWLARGAALSSFPICGLTFWPLRLGFRSGLGRIKILRANLIGTCVIVAARLDAPGFDLLPPQKMRGGGAPKGADVAGHII